ncbi:MAG TPA: AI-2E family transporter, partial [Agromyces sp.]
MIFGKTRDRSDDPETDDATGDEVRRGAGGPIWNDRLGRWAIRSVQILLVTALGALAVWALLQVRLLVIPVLIALILAAAAAPLVAWLRRKGWSPMLAAWTTLLGGLLVLGGIVTLIVFAVRGQWESLVQSATEGFDDLLGWVQELPIPVDQQQIDDWRNSIVDFVTSAEFGQTALTGVSRATEFVT